MEKNRFIKSIGSFLIVFLLIAPTSLLKSNLPLNVKLPDDEFWREDAQEANKNKDHFIEPADSLNYADYHYVGAHNAHVYHRFFQTVRQQDQTILGMLTYGVRGLMLDTYDFNLSKPARIKGPEGAKIALSHGEPGILAFSQKGHQSYQSLQYEVRRILEFMKKNPKAIITIPLENYGDLNRTALEIQAATRAAGYDPILKPKDWPAANKEVQEWPTLGWMRSNNKRLIFFTQSGKNTAVTWQQYNKVIENQYSTTNDNELCTERRKSALAKKNKRALVIMNNFSGMAVTRATRDTMQQVSYDTVKRVVTNCQNKKFADGKIFNGYFADRIVDSCNDLYERKQKTIFEYVNELNAKAQKTTGT